MKTHNIKLALVTLVSLFFTTACEDFVDIKPRGQATAETVAQLEQLLFDNFSMSNLRSLEIQLGSDDLRDFDSETNPFNNQAFGEGQGPMLAFRDYLFPQSLDPRLFSTYNSLYKGINQANIVLETLDFVEGTQADKEKVRGRALVFRANILLELVNVFARHYSESYASEERSGVVIPLSSRADYVLKRNSIQEVYDYIINDLNEGLILLNEIRPETNLLDQPSITSTYGYLARAYLYMGKWDLAKENAENALALYSELYDYKTDIVDGRLPHGFFREDDKENLIVSYNNALAFASGNVPVNPELLALYEAEDLRLSLFYNNGNFFGRHGDSGSGNKLTHSGITVPELMLIRAECNARTPGTGNAQLALDDLNLLREHRFEAGYTPLTDTSDILNLVKEERRRELAFNTWRLIDIKRYNLIDGDNISVTHVNTTTGEVHVLNPTDNNRVLPIPAYNVVLSGLTQNPRDGN